MKEASGVGLSETMKALGDPVRREILNLLKGGRMTAGDIASRFDMTAATVSYHLASLLVGSPAVVAKPLNDKHKASCLENSELYYRKSVEYRAFLAQQGK